MRRLKEDFFEKLKKEHKTLLECIVNDVELDMQIRENYVNVYYKGGNILKIKPRSFDFDKMYFHTLKDKSSTDVKRDSVRVGELAEKREQLLSLLSVQPQEYFCRAKEVMDNWDISMAGIAQHNEKKEQQTIALSNRRNTEYVVLDLEYAVSRNSEFSYNGTGEKQVPRFDIIAIHDGQLVVIELKKGLGAVSGVSGIKPHIDCFNHTIGRDTKGLFIQEMKTLLKQKQDLGLLDKSITISDDKPSFVFAFADEKGRNDFFKFVENCIKNGYKGDFIYLNSSHKLHRAMNRDYYYAERQKQIMKLKKYGASLFENGQSYNSTNNKKVDYILREQDSINNIYREIREEALAYFKKYNISWWKYENKSCYPSGHLVSSQIHCLNHLFALRTDKDSIKEIINEATKMQFDEILPSIIDNDSESFISFEFALDNDKLLREKDEDAKRGTMCTSIDAMILARKGDKKWLIPIEWKYTETYERKDKTNRKREDRYTHLIKKSNRLITPQDGIPHSVYFIEPNYELMRQTLLCEQLIANGYAYDFFHLNIIPKGNTELRNVVNNEFVPMLKDATKFKIIDPQELLSPLKDDKAYEGLFDYLSKRYWDAR
ncbi:MAG: hypothetical protein IKP62_04890 [Salinivirgaceae bacterium]|nr:hypothetical protein [Salinivirgaceae bacterium]